MENINERLLSIMNHYNLGSTAFADEIGAIRPSISHIISGRNKPGLELLQKVLKRFTDISAEWLLTGSGSMLKAGVGENLTKDKEEYQEFNNVIKPEATESVSSELGQQPQPIKKEPIDKKGASTVNRITVYFTDGSYKDYYEA